MPFVCPRRDHRVLAAPLQRIGRASRSQRVRGGDAVRFRRITDQLEAFPKGEQIALLQQSERHGRGRCAHVGRAEAQQQRPDFQQQFSHIGICPPVGQMMFLFILL